MLKPPSPERQNAHPGETSESAEGAQKVLEIPKNLFQKVLRPSETPRRRGDRR
jgi:hypothetical protein